MIAEFIAPYPPPTLAPSSRFAARRLLYGQAGHPASPPCRLACGANPGAVTACPSAAGVPATGPSPLQAQRSVRVGGVHVCDCVLVFRNFDQVRFSGLIWPIAGAAVSGRAFGRRGVALLSFVGALGRSLSSRGGYRAGLSVPGALVAEVAV